MDDKKILRPDFGNHKAFHLPDTSPGVDVEAGGNKQEFPSTAGRTDKLTTDDLAPETDNPQQNDAGVRIREYAITPGRILQTLEKLTAVEEAAGNLPIVR